MMLPLQNREHTSAIPSSLSVAFGCIVWLGVLAGPCTAQATGPLAKPITLLFALEAAVANHPLIRYQRATVEVDRGLKQQASAAFDTLLQAAVTQEQVTTPLTQVQQQQYALIDTTETDEKATITQINANISRLFRNGIFFYTALPLTRDVDDIATPGGVNQASPVLQLTIPLLRGRGRSVVAAQETAAQIEVDASSFDLVQEISQIMTTVATDYWTLAADERLLTIAREAEDRAKTDVSNTGILVKADKLPRENLNEVQANLAQTSSLRIAAEQNVVAAQFQLSNDMGMTPAEILATRLSASDTFPDSRLWNPSYDATLLHGYVDYALSHRADYLASRRRIDEQAVLQTAAQKRLLPQLNLTGSIGYNGLREGRDLRGIVTSLGANLDGPVAQAGLAYSFAPKNDLAIGQLVQARATQAQFQQQSDQLSHTISSSVLTAVRAAFNAKSQKDKAQAAVELYQASLAGQRAKYHLGIASVIDVLTVETNLTNAMTNEVESELQYSQALVQVRYLTGSLLSPNNPVQQVSADDFRTLPSFPTTRAQP